MSAFLFSGFIQSCTVDAKSLPSSSTLKIGLLNIVAFGTTAVVVIYVFFFGINWRCFRHNFYFPLSAAMDGVAATPNVK